jgi:hypothetical protein
MTDAANMPLLERKEKKKKPPQITIVQKPANNQNALVSLILWLLLIYSLFVFFTRFEIHVINLLVITRLQL